MFYIKISFRYQGEDRVVYAADGSNEVRLHKRNIGWFSHSYKDAQTWHLIETSDGMRITHLANYPRRHHHIHTGTHFWRAWIKEARRGLSPHVKLSRVYIVPAPALIGTTIDLRKGSGWTRT